MISMTLTNSTVIIFHERIIDHNVLFSFRLPISDLKQTVKFDLTITVNIYVLQVYIKLNTNVPEYYMSLNELAKLYVY